jgi:hypothetical protein
MKKIIFLAALVAVLLMGCIRAPNYPGMVQIQPDEIAFIVNMTDDGSAAATNVEIQKKDIPVDGYFVRTGRFDHQGYWRPKLRVIAISQAPVKREWDKSDKTMSVKMVSKEQSGFVVPMILNAYIDSVKDAQKYLSKFRPPSDDNVNWSRIEQRDWAPYVKTGAKPLTEALDEVVFTKIMAELGPLFVKIPILYAEASSKILIPSLFNGMKAVDLQNQINDLIPDRKDWVTFAKDIPSLRDWAVEEFGITISTMAFGDGLLFDNDEVQNSIDALAAAIMEQKQLAQEQENARVEQIVRTTRADTERIEANLKAVAMVTLQRQAEIDVIRMVGEAQAQAIKAGHYPPVPTTLITDTKLSAFGFPGLSNLTGNSRQ